MLDFEVRKSSRTCAKSQQELVPGDWFYSYLSRDGVDVVRTDVAAKAWEGPPEDCLGWWKSVVPDPKSKKQNWAPDDVMLHYFSELEETADQEDIRYVLALLLVRRKILQMDESDREGGRETLVLYSGKSDTEFRVPVVPVAAERRREIQNQLSQLLLDAGGK